MLKVLLTGSSGFIGQALARRLISLGCEVVEFSSKQGDIADQYVLKKIDLTGISHVFHLAARTFVPDSWQNPEGFYHVNINGTLQVLELCRQNNIGLTFVSAYIYGTPKNLPISEEDQVEPNNPYAHSKYLAEQLCEYYAKDFGVRVNIIRPFNVYGKGQNNKFLIPHIIHQAMGSGKIIVKDISPKRDYIYIEDLLDAIILISKYNKGCTTFNIGSGYSVSVGQVIDIVQQIRGTTKEVISEKNVRRNEINDVVADISKANRELNWYPKYSIYHGLEEMIWSTKEIQHANQEYTNQ